MPMTRGDIGSFARMSATAGAEGRRRRAPQQRRRRPRGHHAARASPSHRLRGVEHS